MRFFNYKHLSSDLHDISAPLRELACLMDEIVPTNDEKSAGMRKLLEAKDCFVRAALPEE